MKKIHYEIQMIARIIADNSEYYNNSNMLHGGLFIDHADIFSYVVDMMNEGKIPSHDNLMRIFENKQDTILDIITDLDYTIQTGLVIQELHERYRNYTINNAMTRASMAKTAEEKVNILTTMLTELEKNQVKQEIYHVYDVAKELLGKIESGIETGIKTGFADFDKHTGGLQPSDLIVIAARSSQGKTSLGLTICNNLVNSNKKSLFISMELSKPQLTLRLLSSMVEVSAKVAQKNVVLFQHAASNLKSKHFYLADVHNTNYRHIIGMIRAAKLRLGIEVVFIDYLQLMRTDEHKNREQEVGSMARALKNIAKELDIPVVLISQLRRVEGTNYEPKMEDLRDSGQIEEAADLVWLLYRPEFYDIETFEYNRNGQPVTVNTKNRAFHNIAKGRNYGTTRFETGFNADYAKFTETNFTQFNQTTIPEHSPGDHHQQSGIHQDNDTGNEEQPF